MKASTWIAGAALTLLCACFQDSTPQHSHFLPLSGSGQFPDTFPTVRDCRLVAGHENTYQKVLANAVASDPYTSAGYPLPTGSVVVAEQHGDDSSCNSLGGYYLMAKEPPGYDRSSADWHWQQLDANQRIEQDGKLQTCASCHSMCASSDYLCSAP
jgi:hypothetical protein